MGFGEHLSSALSGTFTATRIVPCLTTEFRATLGGTVAAGRKRPTIAPAIVEIVIDVPVETARPTIERSCANEHPA